MKEVKFITKEKFKSQTGEERDKILKKKVIQLLSKSYIDAVKNAGECDCP